MVSPLKFIFRCVEIKRCVRRSAAALESLRGFRFVGYKPIGANAQKCSQACLCRVKGIQIFLFKKLRKEILGQILRVFVRFAPADAHIFVDRFPVRGSNRFERAGTLRRIIATRGQHSGPMRSSKPSVSTADFCVLCHSSVSGVLIKLRPAQSYRFPLENRAVAVRLRSWCVQAGSPGSSAHTLDSSFRNRSCPSERRPLAPRDPSTNPPPPRLPSDSRDIAPFVPPLLLPQFSRSQDHPRPGRK